MLSFINQELFRDGRNLIFQYGIVLHEFCYYKYFLVLYQLQLYEEVVTSPTRQSIVLVQSTFHRCLCCSMNVIFNCPNLLIKEMFEMYCSPVSISDTFLDSWNISRIQFQYFSKYISYQENTKTLVVIHQLHTSSLTKRSLGFWFTQGQRHLSLTYSQ